MQHLHIAASVKYETLKITLKNQTKEKRFPQIND